MLDEGQGGRRPDHFRLAARQLALRTRRNPASDFSATEEEQRGRKDFAIGSEVDLLLVCVRGVSSLKTFTYSVAYKRMD
ncbi:hypothetical protein GLAREA_02478 [Glarea lozoyensis ATCC 20868]|uniref:Uncharacterized protein n=1 Tax=Glarea lozoyensis (strain ATCC 20868 / MF5171) TaxID=1116229 RepID=S3CLD4_GLAL2|nr:uncharacterized protein GLAREA_02478 [Glarea lozoyensis ATCC 20868]EPE26565.1 hypothetical protein GLAREA_02478 [Glarea lozoyensis ATCC 20868]